MSKKVSAAKIRAAIKRRRKIIRKVKKIRTNNNRSWMRILLLAVEENPRKARKILREIINNDKHVTRWMGRL